jgi:hypothetical protein
LLQSRVKQGCLLVKLKLLFSRRAGVREWMVPEISSVDEGWTYRL